MWTGLNVASKITFRFLIVLCVVQILNAVNYCSPQLCKQGSNIACKNSGNFAARCPKNASMIKIAKYRNAILKSHNTKRNLIASGNLKGFSAAQRMATMVWSPELAKMASYNVKRCMMEHDTCRNTFNFPNSGQNLAMMTWSGNAGTNTQSTILKLINSWFAENKMANMGVIQNFHMGQYGHFTVMVADKNPNVGCAASQTKSNGKHTLFLACNYATTNILDNPIYKPGKAASACTTGKNKTFQSLCSTKEKYNRKLN